MTEVQELRITLTVDDFDAAVAPATATPWGDTNTRVAAPDGMQLTLFSLPA